MIHFFKKKLKKAISGIGKGEPVPAPYKPSIQSITDAGIVVYWKKPQGVNGYEIYRSYQEGEQGELAKIIDNPLLGVWSDTEFDDSQREIFYRVRSFVIEGNKKKRVSDFTEQFSAKYIDVLTLERDVTILHSGLARKMKAFYGWREVSDAVWSSSDENIASVDQTGEIAGISKGECTVRCESPSLGMNAQSRVIVDRSAPEPLSEITSRYERDPKTGMYHYHGSGCPGEATVMMVGDLMCGIGQMQKQYTEAEGWNFNDSFEYLREVVAESDFTIGNLETLLDPAWPYMSDEWFINNISNCNAPARYLDAIKYGGFDGVIMSNNHSCDGGIKALEATIDQVDRYQMVHTGAFRSKDEQRFTIVEINGIRIGFVAYMSEATGYNGKDRSWSKEEKATYLNNFSKKKAESNIKDCRKAGAEFVIAYMHWGQKNYKIPTDIQRKEARHVAEAGADFIVGSNPHVLECYDTVHIGHSKKGKEIPCYYSIGNFHARMNQITGNRDSVIVRIKLKRENGNVVLAENNYIPCYTYSMLNDNYLTPASLLKEQNADVERKGRLKKLERIKSSIGDKVEVYQPKKA